MAQQNFRLCSYFSNKQCGFRQNLPPIDAITNVNDNFIKDIDNDMCTCSVFLELSKAFDTVGHDIVPGKLPDFLNQRKTSCTDSQFLE